jgi:hypothetical protein
MIRFPHKKLLLLIALSLVLLTACGSAKPIVTVDLQEQVTQTMQAVATNVQATLQAAVPTPAPPTHTPPPTATLTPTDPPPPAQSPTVTSTPGAVQPVVGASGVTLRINDTTNCRTGPSIDFPLVFTAQKDAVLNIVSNTSVSKYVIVANPANLMQTCWLWTEYTTITGDLASLPVTTPEPLPTPQLSFVPAYYRIETCNDWSIAFKVTNAGLKTLNSYTVVVEDLTEEKKETHTSNDFDLRNGCAVETPISALHTGETGYVYARRYSYDPKGHSMRATFTVCTHNELAGDCYMAVLVFSP